MILNGWLQKYTQTNMPQNQYHPFLTLKLSEGHKTDSLQSRKQSFYNYSNFWHLLTNFQKNLNDRSSYESKELFSRILGYFVSPIVHYRGVNFFKSENFFFVYLRS